MSLYALVIIVLNGSRLLNAFKRPEGILARWIETLAEFDYEIEH